MDIVHINGNHICPYLESNIYRIMKPKLDGIKKMSELDRLRLRERQLLFELAMAGRSKTLVAKLIAVSDKIDKAILDGLRGKNQNNGTG